jgi:hypothetical protein
MKHIIVRSILSLLYLVMVNPIFSAEANLSPEVKVETAIHFIATDGSDVLVKPGTYQLEVAEAWLRLVPGERRDALLLEAQHTQHEEILHEPKALLKEVEGNAYRLLLLLPDGTGLEAMGSFNGVRSRAVRRPLTSRARNKQQTSRIPTRSKKTTVAKKTNPLSKSPALPNDPLVQRIQTLEQQVSTLLATIDALQNRLATIESAVHVNNSGQVTVQGTTVKLNGSMIDVQAATSRFSGVVQSDTLITNSVISKSYTPGAGNIW